MNDTELIDKKKQIVQHYLNQKRLAPPEVLTQLESSESVELLWQSLIHHPKTTQEFPALVTIKTSFTDAPKKREIGDFVAHFSVRFREIEHLLRNRAELSQVLSISRILQKKDREPVTLIGMISDKTLTQNGNIIITIEDLTGQIKVLFSKTRKEAFDLAKDLTLDEVIGVSGQSGQGIIFGSQIVHPDVPLTKELKKGPDEVYAVFISDIHVGSKQFLINEFEKFIDWINGRIGSPEHRAIASKIRYLFVIGDVVDGVGIYPGMESDLALKDIQSQYTEAARLFAQIPPFIKIIMCPGNHDAMRLAEPQLCLPKDFAKPLWDLPNIVMVSNPSVVTIHETSTFSGFDVLLYHGYSFDYYAANIDSIRLQGGYDRSDLIMKYLLQRRHLAPAHASSLYIPTTESDPLVIRTIPDFFVTGHIHRSTVSHYRNITLLSGSCWQSKTDFQEKTGHNPEPCRVPVINLKTREVKIIKFIDEELPQDTPLVSNSSPAHSEAPPP